MTVVNVVNIVDVAAISRRNSTEDLDGSREGWRDLQGTPVPPTLNVNVST